MDYCWELPALPSGVGAVTPLGSQNCWVLLLLGCGTKPQLLFSLDCSLLKRQCLTKGHTDLQMKGTHS